MENSKWSNGLERAAPIINDITKLKKALIEKSKISKERLDFFKETNFKEPSHMKVLHDVLAVSKDFKLVKVFWSKFHKSLISFSTLKIFFRLLSMKDIDIEILHLFTKNIYTKNSIVKAVKIYHHNPHLTYKDIEWYLKKETEKTMNSNAIFWGLFKWGMVALTISIIATVIILTLTPLAPK